MKQVTIESIRQRIADLESAGKVVGGLSLSSEFELACLRELVALSEQRDALVVENHLSRNAVQTFCDVVGGNTYAICEEVGEDGVRAILAAMKATGNMSATDAEIASLRAEAFNDLCKAFVLHKESACLNDTDKVSVREATDALLHCAEQLASQLRESKGEVQS